MNRKNLKEILRLAIPATLESLFIVLITMLDTWMVSPLGVTAIAAVAVANQPKILLFIVFTALGTATTITVSHAYGRKDRDQVGSLMLFSVKAAVVISVILAAAVVICARPIMVVCSNQPDTMDMSVIYLRIIIVGMVFQAVSTAMNAALRGTGKMKATLASSVTMGVVDIIFNYLLIEGHLGFPALGVAGAAIATALGNFAGLLVSLGFLCKKNGFLNLKYSISSHVRLSKKDAADLRGKLINVFCENILLRVGFLISGIIAARLGSYETSIYSIGVQLLGFSFAFGDGIQAATLVLVGECVGSGDKETCLSYIRTAERIGIVISFGVAAACIALGGPFFSLFNSDAAFIQSGFNVSIFAAFAVPFQILRIVRVSILRGFGDTRRPAIIAAISVLAVDPPMSFLFAMILNLGQSGLWIGTLISQFVWSLMAELITRKAVKRFKWEGTL